MVFSEDCEQNRIWNLWATTYPHPGPEKSVAERVELNAVETHKLSYSLYEITVWKAVYMEEGILLLLKLFLLNL